MPPLSLPPDRTLTHISRTRPPTPPRLTSLLHNHIRSLLSYPPYLPNLSDVIPRQHIHPAGDFAKDEDWRPYIYEPAATTTSSVSSMTTTAAPTSTLQALVFGPTPTSIPKLSEEQVERIKDVLETVTENKERENGFKKAAKAIERFLSQGIPHPNRHQDWHAESDKVVEFLKKSWVYIVWAVCSLFVVMLFLIFLVWLARQYDKRCVTKGRAEWGVDMHNRDARLALACIIKGRALRERMDAEKAERLKTEEARWWAYVDEALAERRRMKGILAREGVVTSIVAVGGESLGIGHEDITILPVSAGRPSQSVGSRPGGNLVRNPSKRSARRGEGTQFFSDETDGMRRRESVKGKHRPAGGSEARVEMLIRSVSARSVRRARREEEPDIMFGHYHTTRGLVNMSEASSRRRRSANTGRGSESRTSVNSNINNNNTSFDNTMNITPTPADPLLAEDAAVARHLVKALSRNPISYEGAQTKPVQKYEVKFERSGKKAATELEMEKKEEGEEGEKHLKGDELEQTPFLAARNDSRGRLSSREYQWNRAGGIAATEPEMFAVESGIGEGEEDMPFLSAVATPASGRSGGSEGTQLNYSPRIYGRAYYSQQERVQRASGRDEEAEVGVEGASHGRMSSVFSRGELGIFHEDLMFPNGSVFGRESEDKELGRGGCVWQ